MKKITVEQIEKCKKDTLWSYTNKVLYGICSENPKHDNQNIIAGKLILIGKTYSAALERGAKYKSSELYKRIAKIIAKEGRQIDDAVNMLSKKTIIDIDVIVEAVKLHSTLLELLREVSGKTNRSLASKYLHFHLPNIYYIYDSLACESIKNYVSSDKIIVKTLKNKLAIENITYDADYLNFYIKVHTLIKDIKNEFDVFLTPREIDRLLLNCYE